ncbi:MAG TPA: site-2 protease family protein [Candidatus Dormibacteraeota bacterium]|nr:site-2 protease family protein [Candidatus Dormibacteraeota bacterium]
MSDTLYKIAIMAPPILFSIILHEIAHGWVANRLGDDTAARAGRLTLNPIPHIDPFGSVILPLLLAVSGSPFLFGWAKPVPVHFANLRQPKRDMVAVALAGPGTNLILAVVFTLLARALAPVGLRSLALMAMVGVQINVVLAVFNLLPILPLDGGRVLFGLLPMPAARAFARLEPYGMLIVIALLATGVLGTIVGPVTRTLLNALLS